MRFTWHKKIYLIIPFVLFLIMDSFIRAVNSIKIPNGGWVAIVIGTCFSILSFSWYFGQLKLHRFLKIHAPITHLRTLALRLDLVHNHYRNNSQSSIPELPMISRTNQIEMINESDSDSDDNFKTNDTEGFSPSQSRVKLVKNLASVSSHNILADFQHVDPNMRCIIAAVITPGVGCFLTNSKKYTPHVFESYLVLMHAVPQVIIFLQVEFAKTSTVENEKRIIVRAYSDNIYHITALYGYSENRIQPFDILSLVRTLFQVPILVNEMKVIFFMAHEKIQVSTV